MLYNINESCNVTANLFEATTVLLGVIYICLKIKMIDTYPILLFEV